MGALGLGDLEELAAGTKTSIWAGEVPADVGRQLGLRNRDVSLNARTLRHIYGDHPDVIPHEILKIPIDLKEGLWLQERAKPNLVIVSRYDAMQRTRYMTIMRTSGAGTEMWVAGYYRVNARQMAALFKRCRMLRSHL